MTFRGASIDYGLWGLALVPVAIELAFKVGFTPLHAGVALVLFFALGLSHGALDRWLFDRVVPGGASGMFYGFYLGAAALQALLWWASPQLAFVLFLVLSVLHLGAGEVQDDRMTDLHRGLASVARGLLVVGVPLLVHADAVRPVLSALSVALPTVSSTMAFALTAAMLSSNLLVFALPRSAGAFGGRREGWRSTAHEWIQTAVLTGMFVVLPPLFSFLVYFTLWHGLAHVREMKARFAQSGEAWEELGGAALPFAAAASGGLLALWALTSFGASTGLDIATASAAAVVLVSALTLPHMLLVSMARWLRPAAVGLADAAAPGEPNLSESRTEPRAWNAWTTLEAPGSQTQTQP
ncbi:MAG: Brp/Blh family beta-carotene 15,15'-dioxygenase [Myxococcota bacterium]